MKFELKARVAITRSGETGEITGRAEYTTAEPSYHLRYTAADGRAVDGWFSESELSAAA